MKTIRDNSVSGKRKPLTKETVQRRLKEKRGGLGYLAAVDAAKYHGLRY